MQQHSDSALHLFTVQILQMVHRHMSPDQFAAQMHPLLFIPSLSVRTTYCKSV